MTKTMLTASDGMTQSLLLPMIDLRNPGLAIGDAIFMAFPHVDCDLSLGRHLSRCLRTILGLTRTPTFSLGLGPEDEGQDFGYYGVQLGRN